MEERRDPSGRARPRSLGMTVGGRDDGRAEMTAAIEVAGTLGLSATAAVGGLRSRDGVGRQNVDGTYGVRNWHFVGWLAIFRSRVASWASMTSAAATYVAS